MSDERKLWDWIQEKEKELKEKRIELDGLLHVFKEIPDATYSIDRWKNFRIHSPMVNASAVDVDIRHGCGCCGDSPILARPYITIDGVQIFSIPESFNIGEKGYDCEHPYPGWRTKMIDNGISMDVIEQVEKYFEENKQSDCEDEEDDLLDY